MRRLEKGFRAADVAALGHYPRPLVLALEDKLHKRLGGLAVGVEDARSGSGCGVDAAAVGPADQLRRYDAVEVEKERGIDIEGVLSPTLPPV